MIQDEQVLELISEEFPNVGIMERKHKGLFKCFDNITDYALGLIQNQQTKKLERLMNMIQQIEGRCGPRVAMAIENIFLYRIGTCIVGSGDREKLFSSIPLEFRDKIVQQMVASKI